jgi:tetratricopeptide (TPR) repeat protein
LLAVGLLTPALPAQAPSSEYRETVLAIQQQIQANHLDEAKLQANAALKRYAANGGLENLLGIIAIQQGDAREAKQDFARAIAHDPKLVSAYLNLARIDMQSGESSATDRTRTLQLYEKVVQLDHGNAEANFEAATLLASEHKYQLSLEHLHRLERDARGQIGAEALLCADEAALGHAAAASHAAQALAANPSLTEQDADSVLPALRAAHRADLIDLIFSAANQRQPLSVAGLRIIGLAQEVEGKEQQARATLERVFEMNPSDPEPLIDLTRIALATKDYQGALGYLAHARSLRPDDASLSYEFSLICLKLNLVGEATRAMTEALKQAPDNPTYNFAMGTLASLAQDPSKGLPYLLKYHTMRPDDQAAVMALGAAYFRDKDFDSAKLWLQRAADFPATAAEADYYLGRILRQENESEKALAEVTKSDQLKPNQPEVLAEMGLVYMQMHDLDKAQHELDRALQLDPNSYSANFALLQLYATRHDPRRTEQAKKFDEIKGENDEEYRKTMRVLEIRPVSVAENHVQ